MQTVFIRHNIASTNAILEDLWTQSLIALHYEDISSTDPNDYDRPGKNALKRFHKFCDSGAIVGADFRKIRPASMLVGHIAPGSEIAAKRFPDPLTQHEYIYKVVQLQDAKEISFLDYPLLAGIQPPGTAISAWPSAETCLKSALDGTPMPAEVASLHPSQLEVLCYEYLKAKHLIDVLLAPIGRNMVNVDIVGINSTSDTVFAQVTHSKSRRVISEKLELLNASANQETKLYFFGSNSMKSEGNLAEFISLEKVFDFFITSNEAVHKELVSKMLGEK